MANNDEFIKLGIEYIKNLNGLEFNLDEIKADLDLLKNGGLKKIDEIMNKYKALGDNAVEAIDIFGDIDEYGGKAYHDLKTADTLAKLVNGIFYEEKEFVKPYWCYNDIKVARFKGNTGGAALCHGIAQNRRINGKIGDITIPQELIYQHLEEIIGEVYGAKINKEHRGNLLNIGNPKLPHELLNKIYAGLNTLNEETYENLEIKEELFKETLVAGIFEFHKDIHDFARFVPYGVVNDFFGRALKEEGFAKNTYLTEVDQAIKERFVKTAEKLGLYSKERIEQLNRIAGYRKNAVKKAYEQHLAYLEKFNYNIHEGHGRLGNDILAVKERLDRFNEKLEAN